MMVGAEKKKKRRKKEKQTAMKNQKIWQYY